MKYDGPVCVACPYRFYLHNGFCTKFKTVVVHITNKQEIVKSVILVTSTRKKAVKC